jgi:beta-hydroxyacyl-ACP dehydratase FabZ
MTSQRVDLETSREMIARLPHRHPFLLVDRILEFEPGKRIVSLKGITNNEPFFAGHFPGFPIMPGVLVIEAMVQTGGVLALENMKGLDENILPVFTRIAKARFRRPILPGDQLRMEIEILRHRHPVWWFTGKGFVDGELAAEGEVQATMSNMGNHKH